LRQAMTGSKPSEAQEACGVTGFRPFSSPSAQLVTNEQVDAIRDHDGI
jgi:hypothetical protein